MNREVLLVRTGTSNQASVVAALRRLDVAVRTSDEVAEILAAPRVIVPGVGAFAAARETLDRAGLVPALRERIEAGKPTLTICLGLQLLAEGSEESPDVPGLGILPGRAERFPKSVSVPQLGWNEVSAPTEAEILKPGFAYFANSYRLLRAPKGWSVSWAQHGGPFVAAVERGNVLGCQFHPELSGAFGRGLLQRWLVRSSERSAAAC